MSDDSLSFEEIVAGFDSGSPSTAVNEGTVTVEAMLLNGQVREVQVPRGSTLSDLSFQLGLSRDTAATDDDNRVMSIDTTFTQDYTSVVYLQNVKGG